MLHESLLFPHFRPPSLNAQLRVWDPSCTAGSAALVLTLLQPLFPHPASLRRCCTLLTFGAGLAAVATSVASYMAHPAALADPVHLTSTFLGTFIGAVTLTGRSAHMGIPVTLQLCRAALTSACKGVWSWLS